jgi:RecA/RadA recombinase
MDMENTSIAADGLSAAECDGYLDTGSYALNALLSGSIYKGMPNNKSIVFAGPTSTGKTFFALGIAKHFLDANPDVGVMYFDTEAAVSRQVLQERGIDPERVILTNVATIENFRLQAAVLVNSYMDKKDRPRMIMVLDSLGLLASNKAMKDAIDEKKMDTKDMSLQQVIKSTFRILRLKMAQAKMPLIVTNHTYASMNPYGERIVMQGGGGPQYAADDIFFISKKKDTVGEKDERKVVGNIVTVKAWKSRNARENETVECRISYDSGLDLHHGLLDIATRGNVLTRPRGKSYYLFGQEQIPSDDMESGKAWGSKRLLDAVDSAAARIFDYGTKPEPIIGVPVDGEEGDVATVSIA